MSRLSSRDSSNHQILGVQTERPEQLASQLTLDLHNAWGILHAIIDYCRELDPGKYIIMKDPNKASTYGLYIHLESFSTESFHLIQLYE